MGMADAAVLNGAALAPRFGPRTFGCRHIADNELLRLVWATWIAATRITWFRGVPRLGQVIGLTDCAG
jgi:hypothetical protein